MSPYSYSPDEFDADDDGISPVGVHRAQLPAWRSWLPLLLVIVIAPVLAWGAVTMLGDSAGSTSTNTSSKATTTPQAEEPSVSPTASIGNVAPETGASSEATASSAHASTDFTLGVTVHNGTTISGLAGRTGDRLRNAGYTAVTVSQGIYSGTDPMTSTVFYGDEKNQPTARALADTLGIQNVQQSVDATGSNPLVVVLRADFQE
ncbi:LytR C-terminal domain-containing protein [Actinomyces trachealis]|uniref:LytR C-terminal domain-containing protein n=1 Tax=Actinomyces trachealis TaxID=2763540 RepID=UPI001892A7A9|nr:LytR C-terminal domain-containing protein [Actinomyces trachealis]